MGGLGVPRHLGPAWGVWGVPRTPGPLGSSGVDSWGGSWTPGPLCGGGGEGPPDAWAPPGRLGPQAPRGQWRRALRDLAALFPRRSSADALPPLVLRHQLYSVVGDRTAVDRHLNRLRDEGRIRLLHLGFEGDALAVVFTEPYTAKVGAGGGAPQAGLVRRFLETGRAACPELSYEQSRVRALGFADADVTQLVAAGVLTVRDAGSWWLAVPGAGRFVKAFVRGRRALLAAIRRSRYKEVALAELGQRRGLAGAPLGVAYHIHDLVGAQLVRRIPSASGTLLRLAET
ncbi:LOW QUALITY PROTEIN: inactive serine/threonine-protein kinase 19 [Rhea pennata]|uniref:LOW QUALITY PROTEIN: inactive serine/threonine-protein kinase 19 n=1 Tax=Rhea pennata TaxID=8795 RepID=UPI002E26A072